MAKKQTTLYDVYAATLLSRYNTTIQECTVLGFEFPTTVEQYEFHYALMLSPIKYHFYDGATGNRANVVMPVNSPDLEPLKELAIDYKGKYYKPNLRQ